MAEKEIKFKGSLTMGKLELACEAEEQSWGDIQSIEAVAGWTVATFDDASFPTLSSLAILPKIGGMQPPAPHQAEHLFDGAVTVLGVALDVSVFRTN